VRDPDSSHGPFFSLPTLHALKDSAGSAVFERKYQLFVRFYERYGEFKLFACDFAVKPGVLACPGIFAGTGFRFTGLDRESSRAFGIVSAGSVELSFLVQFRTAREIRICTRQIDAY